MKRRTRICLEEPVDRYVEEHKKEYTLWGLIEKYAQEKDMTVDVLFREAEINRDLRYKVFQNSSGTYHRDYLWRLAIVLRLTVDETELLFNTCGMTIKNCRGYGGGLSDYDRERIIEFGIVNGWGIDEIDEALDKRGFDAITKEVKNLNKK